jgi:hypothetical protein
MNLCPNPDENEKPEARLEVFVRPDEKKTSLGPHREDGWDQRMILLSAPAHNFIAYLRVSIQH